MLNADALRFLDRIFCVDSIYGKSVIINVDLENLVDAVHRGVAGDGHHIVSEEDFALAARCVVVVELDLDDVAFFVEVGLCGIESGQTFHFSAVVCHVPDCHCA